MGVQTLRKWLRQPTCCREILEERYDTLEFFLKIENLDLKRELKQCLRSVPNVPSLLHRMKCYPSVADWEHAFKVSDYITVNHNKVT
jgi:DNA mismatch repair ATPase MutS